MVGSSSDGLSSGDSGAGSTTGAGVSFSLMSSFEHERNIHDAAKIIPPR